MILILTDADLVRESTGKKLEELKVSDFRLAHNVMTDASLIIFTRSTREAIVVKARYIKAHEVVTLEQALWYVPLHITR
jgi:hypothetical protein